MNFTSQNHSEPAEIYPLAIGPRDAANALGISERLLWSITADQTSGIPHFRLGRRVLYPVDQLHEWMTGQVEKGGRK